eukprot:jgi/Botrbrau1/22395/Bobra.0091s0006.1
MDLKRTPFSLFGFVVLLWIGSEFSVAQTGDMGLNETEAEFASEIQRRLITAALHKREADRKGDGAPAPSAHAQAPTRLQESDLESPSKAPEQGFTETPLPTTDKLTGFHQTPKGLKGADANFPVKNVEQLRPLSDAEMFQIFHKGTAEIPSAVPGQKGKFTMCLGRPLLNVYTTEGWPNATLPQGDFDFWNNFIDRLWRGKIIYTNPTTNDTMLWNLFMNNSTVDITGNVTILPGGISEDNRDSMIVNYTRTGGLFFRTIRDELRRVGPSVWLGRAWVINPIEAWQPTDLDPALKPIVDTALQIENATWMNYLMGSALEGPLSDATTAGGVYRNVGQPLALLWFGIECSNFPIPKLHYAPVVAPAAAFVNSVSGYQAPFYSLPDLQQYARAGDPGAVDHWTHSFPMSNAGNSRPYVLWPYTLDQPEGPLKGYLELPASWFEPLFGAYWAINNFTVPIENQVNAAADALHTQDIDEYFPDYLYNLTITNPLLPYKNQTEAVQSQVRAALAPIVDPFNAAILGLNNTIVAPTGEALKQGGLAVSSALAPAFLGAVHSIPNIGTGFGVEAPLPSTIRSISKGVASEIDQNAMITTARKALTDLTQAPALAPSLFPGSVQQKPADAEN